jgi:ribonucleoside-diphosphate reductase alpha chain
MNTPQKLFPMQEKDLAQLLEASTANETSQNNGLAWKRLFGEGDPYEALKWEIRTAKITKGTGQVVFEQKNVEVPDFWTQTATDIVASKYFRGRLDSPQREKSAREMINRVANTIAEWGIKKGYFRGQEDGENFKNDLKYLLINQWAAFNSPVWFNVGVYPKPQCSACFILSVDDSMESIFDWYRDEGWIFKYGSGSGTNLSKLRSSFEPLSRGGFSSGPVSFMKGADGIANSIRSGGTTRRAAKW